MKFKLQRETLTSNSTIGSLSIDGVFECYILEDVVRPPGQKVNGKTAIPAGIYQMNITYSPKFERYMILIENVPMFTGIRMHSGNWAEDTEGCLITGQSKGVDAVFSSRLAYAILWMKIIKYISNPTEKIEPMTIEIIDAVQKPEAI